MGGTVKTFLARVGLKPRGTYSDKEHYDYKDFFNYNGSSFVVLKKEGVTGITPVADNVNFMMLAERGEKLKFSDLSPEEIDLLKLHFSELTEEDIALLQKPAKDAAALANEATGKANEAAELANKNAGKADTAAGSANDEAGKARIAADLANEKAGLAVAAAGMATTATDGADRATENANNAATEARNVPVIQNGTFWLYDPAQKKYIDTGSSATGKSPQARDGIWWEYNDEIGDYVSTNISASSDYELTKPKVENVLTGDIATHSHATQLADALADYVKKVAGKDLSTEDFTTTFKNKLVGLENYDDAAVLASIATINQRIDTLLGSSASSAIDTFHEIEAFLAGITDVQTLTGLLADLKTEITALIPTKLSQIQNDDNTVKDANYIHTDNNYTSVEKQKLGKINFVPTLDHEPGESDLTFSDSDGEHTFLIGNQARVMDAEKSEYVFWQLYDIAAGKAVWKKAGSGGDMQLTEKVNITLSSNQAQPDSALNGAVIHLVYGDNDTPFTWQNGSVFSAEIPMNMTYRVIYPTIAGYATPEEVEFIALAGNTRTVNAMYNTTIMTIDVASNQTDKSALNNLQIVLSGSMNKILTYTGQPLSLKVPTGKQIVITSAQVEGYAAVAAVTKTPTAATDAVTFTYNTTVTSLILTSNQGVDSALNGTNIVVKYGDVTKNLTWQGSALSIKIPTGSSYSVSSGSITGYNTPAPKTQTATGTTGEVSLAYTTEKATINVTADDGGSVATQTLTVTNTANNSVLYSGKAGAGIIVKIPFQTSYKVSVNDFALYIKPEDQTFTASTSSRTVSVVYEKIKSAQITFDKSISDPSNISGDINTSIIGQILSKWRRCLCKKKAEGQVTIAYLKNDNSNYYEDGTAAKLDGTEGDVMVYKPEFYYKYESLGGTKFAYRLSFFNVDGTYIHSPESLIGAYKCYCVGNRMYSRSGVTPTASQSTDTFDTWAKARGTGYQRIDYEQHCMIALMFYAKYGTRNSQSVLGAGGAMYNSNNTTGSTNSRGNSDTKNETANYVNFLGIEGVHGCLYEWVSGVTINSYVWTITNPDGTTRTVTAHSGDGWIVEIAAAAGTFFDLVPTQVGGSETTYYSDYYYRNTGTRVLARSCYSAYTYGGVSYTSANLDSSDAYAGCGCRLAFRGVIREASSVSAFKALQVL